MIGQNICLLFIIGFNRMMNGYPGYQQEASQLIKSQWPYLEAKNYSDW
jgi:hypothetical protein